MTNKTRLQATINEVGLLPIDQTGLSERSLRRIENDFPVTYRHGVIHFKADHVSADQDCNCESGRFHVQDKGFNELVTEHQTRLQKRSRGKDAGRYVMAEEHMPPTGQAGLWYDDVVMHVSRSARDVAKQIARLCRDDSQVTTTYRSLMDAVGIANAAGNQMQYVQGGIDYLKESGWLQVDTIDGKTTFSLLPGGRTSYNDKWDERYFDDESLLAHELHWVA